jgi:hypothetical protein
VFFNLVRPVLREIKLLELAAVRLLECAHEIFLVLAVA